MTTVNVMWQDFQARSQEELELLPGFLGHLLSWRLTEAMHILNGCVPSLSVGCLLHSIVIGMGKIGT